MSEPIAVLALRRRRDQISGIIAEYERKIKEAQHDLVHVVASLRLFELTGEAHVHFWTQSRICLGEPWPLYRKTAWCVMATPKSDRRTERTRASLLTAFRVLVLSEGYGAVSVERLCERANVGRSTFYMHFRSKEDILRNSITHPSSHLAAIIGNDVGPEALLPVLTHFYEQRRLNRVFFEVPIRTVWVKRLAEMEEPRIASVARSARGRPILPLPLIALQLAEMQISLVAHWLTHRSAVTPDVIAEALIASTHAHLAALLRCKLPRIVPG